MSDNGAATTTHGVRCTLTLHDIGATRHGTSLLQLLLADFSLGKEAQKLTDSGLGLLSGRLDLGRELQSTTGKADADRGSFEKRLVETGAELCLELGIGFRHQLLQTSGTAGASRDKVEANLAFLVRRIGRNGLTDDALGLGQHGVRSFIVDADNVRLMEIFNQRRMVAAFFTLDKVDQLTAEALGLGALRQRESIRVHRTVVGQHHVHRGVCIRHAESSGGGSESNNKLHGYGGVKWNTSNTTL